MKNLRSRLAGMERDDGSISLDSIREYLAHEGEEGGLAGWVIRQVEKGLLAWVDLDSVYLVG